MPGCSARARALTKVETAVVVGVALLLIAAAGSIWAGSRERARAATCRAVLGRYANALAAYADDHGGVLPYENVGHRDQGHVVWREALEAYMGRVGRDCPSVDRGERNYSESYRINSRLGRRDEDGAAIYGRLDALSEPQATVVLFDAEYGGKKLSLKGKLSDVDYRHGRTANLLFADWHAEGLERERLEELSNWIPPKVIWDPGQ